MSTTRQAIITFLENEIREMGIKSATENKEIDYNANIQEVYGYDSLDAVELIMKCEKEYNIAIPDNIGEELYTINQIANFIEAELKKGE